MRDYQARQWPIQKWNHSMAWFSWALILLDWTLMSNQTTQTHQKLSSLAPVLDAEHLGPQALHKQLFCHAEPPKISMARLALVIPHQTIVSNQTTVIFICWPKGTYRHIPTPQLRKHMACTHAHSSWLDIHLVITGTAWYICLNLHSNST